MIYLVLSMVMLLAMAVSVVLIGMIFKIGLGPYIKNRREPLRSTQAAVVSKREELAESCSHNFERRFGEAVDPADAARLEPVDWFATFRFEDDDNEREFSVPQPVYESLIIGDSGQLAWRGNSFIHFSLPGEDTGPSRTDRTVPDDWR